jgi:hypothetical protein
MTSGVLICHLRQRLFAGSVPCYHEHARRAPDKRSEAFAGLPLILDKDNSDWLRH